MLRNYMAKIGDFLGRFYNNYMRPAGYLLAFGLAVYALVFSVSLVIKLLPWLLVGAGLYATYKAWDWTGAKPPAEDSGFLVKGFVYAFMAIKDSMSRLSGLWNRFCTSPALSADKPGEQGNELHSSADKPGEQGNKLHSSADKPSEQGNELHSSAKMQNRMDQEPAINRGERANVPVQPVFSGVPYAGNSSNDPNTYKSGLWTGLASKSKGQSGVEISVAGFKMSKQDFEVAQVIQMASNLRSKRG